MQAGRIDRKITIQRKTLTQSASGETIETWASVTHRRSASVSPINGDERFGGDQYVASEQTEFRIRYSSDVASLTPKDRVIYPPPSAAGEQTPTFSTVYEIMAVHELGRNEGLRIMTARRPDVA